MTTEPDDVAAGPVEGGPVEAHRHAGGNRVVAHREGIGMETCMGTAP